MQLGTDARDLRTCETCVAVAEKKVFGWQDQQYLAETLYPAPCLLRQVFAAHVSSGKNLPQVFWFARRLAHCEVLKPMGSLSSAAFHMRSRQSAHLGFDRHN